MIIRLRILKARNFRYLKTFFFLLMFTLTMIACGSGNPNGGNNEVSSGSGDGEVVEQSETLEEFSIILGFRFGLVDSEGDNLFNLMTGYDMQPEYIRVWGTYSRPNGESAPGFADVTFSVENGELVTKIIETDMEGVDVDDPRVLQFNEDIANSFKDRLMETAVGFVSVELVNNTMEIVYLAEVE
ncbi:MAG: hypothetical protein HON98_00795 [Chloroflexi bacterium]|jgi:hypothetical protein|nr:hypothetical protein [Chloroflexota bacterium]MBT3669676.1 hypothetical protein [Chloroflexota bacterium]MBT4003408.1 hypothetical protein [Chloroflexota bacterium]MBT4305073.1 hypothetical protein [Chloroflexota bacterium]MBT4533406.1 hypothetical protein [Chloroflexota bacterium]